MVNWIYNKLLRINIVNFLVCCSFWRARAHTHISFFVLIWFNSIWFISFCWCQTIMVTNENRINWQWPQTKIKTWTIKAKRPREKKREKNQQRRPFSFSCTHMRTQQFVCVILFLDWPYIDGFGLFRFNDETNLLLLLRCCCCRCFFYSIYELSVTIHSPDYFSQN